MERLLSILLISCLCTLIITPQILAENNLSILFIDGTIVLDPDRTIGTKISCNDIIDNTSSVCNPTGGGGNASDGFWPLFSDGWLYNSTGNLRFNETRADADYQEDIGADCAAGDFVKGVDDNGVLDCATPLGGSGNLTEVYTPEKYLLGGDGTIEVNITLNESQLNATIDARDSDTTYTNGTGLNLTGTTFSIITSYFNNWNTAFGWGDHSLAGYLTSEVDGSTTNELQNIFQTISTTSGTNPVADGTNDTLTLSAGAGITVTGDSATDTITIASTVTDTNNYTVSAAFEGTTTKTLQLAQSTGNNITASFTDIDTDTNANTLCAGTTTYLDGEGNCDDISSVYYDSEADLTALLNDNYVDVTGDTMTGALNMSNNNVTNVDCIVFQSGGQICTA